MSDIERQCANCGAPQPARYCAQCGQHERGSQRLRVRDVASHCTEALLDVESALPATLIGLIRNPGRVCREYVQGRRKRYMNPFALLLVALTAQILLSALLRWMGGTSAAGEVSQDAANELPDEAITWMLFAALLPLALLWTKMFAMSGRNFAENYVLGLYLLGLLAWLEIVILPFTFIWDVDAFLFGSLAVLWLSLTTWAGTEFYSLAWYAVAWRMAVASTVAFVFMGLLFAIFL